MTGSKGAQPALREAIDAEVPEGIGAINAEAQNALAALLVEARQAQQQRLQQSLERALGHLPRLLRMPVRRVLFPERR